MKINVKKVGPYKEVNVSIDNTSIDLNGLMDSEQCMTLARVLKEAIQDLIDGRDESKRFLEE